MFGLACSLAENALAKIFNQTATTELFSVTDNRKVGEIEYVEGSSKSFSRSLLDATATFNDEMKIGLWYINPFTTCRQTVRIK